MMMVMVVCGGCGGRGGGGGGEKQDSDGDDIGSMMMVIKDSIDRQYIGRIMDNWHDHDRTPSV